MDYKHNKYKDKYINLRKKIIGYFKKLNIENKIVKETIKYKDYKVNNVLVSKDLNIPITVTKLKIIVDDVTLDKVTEFINLEYLDISNSDLCGAGLKNLCKLDKLISLNLSNTNISSSSLEYLLGFIKMRINKVPVELWGKKVIDPQIVYDGYDKQINLKYINLSNCLRVTDNSLYYLSQIQSLENINLYGNNISNNIIINFKKYLNTSIYGL
jgi:hypothetical protein